MEMNIINNPFGVFSKFNNSLSIAVKKNCIYTQHWVIHRQPTWYNRDYSHAGTHTFHMNTPWRHGMETEACFTEHIICGPAAKWTHLPVIPKFHTKMTLTSLVGTERDGPDKRSAFWVKPVWLCGLAGVTHVFPVSLHPKAYYWTCVYILHSTICRRLCILQSLCLCVCSSGPADGCLPHKARSTLCD